MNKDKLVSINDSPINYYRVTRKITQVTQWYIDSDKELSAGELEYYARWREHTGGNKKFPYGMYPNTKMYIDVGWGHPYLDGDSEIWEGKQLTVDDRKCDLQISYQSILQSLK
tara:strand:+ start:34 stop:372 length:339 start_codon:yes stop_codon:yes gene_type:complete